MQQFYFRAQTKCLLLGGLSPRFTVLSAWGLVRAILVLTLFGCCGLPFALQAQIPTTLTDKIHKGSGVIDLLRDVSGATLEQYIGDNGGLLLGVDLNEDLSGNESSDSIGVAIKELELVITTTEGTFSFTDFFTSTTAMIQEAGSGTAEEFYTLFGSSGSSAINGGTSGFDLSSFDDVIRLENVSFEGSLLSAELNITFLDTADTGVQGNETFFDFSNGFEDFALLAEQDAAALEAAEVGVAEAPTSLTFTAQSVPAAPAPPVWLLSLFGLVMLMRGKGK